VRGGERVEGEDVGLGVFGQRRHLQEPAVEVRDGFGEPVARLLEVVGVEDRADQRRQQSVLVLAGMAQAVAQEVAVMPTSA
jgi:hypothetical protein